MKVELLAHTQLTVEKSNELFQMIMVNRWNDVSDGQAIALTAIRTCYSHNESSKIVEVEGQKYFGKKATDGGKGSDADRLIRHIVKSKHVSTVEHLNFTFAIEGVSRSLLAQLTRHRHMSFSVQSQRYCKFSSDSRSGGFEFVVPKTVDEDKKTAISYANHKEDSFEWTPYTALEVFETHMRETQKVYDLLIKSGVPQEDARAVLPNAATCNLVLTANLRTLLDFYSKRKPGNGGQLEITQLAEKLRKEVVNVESWTDEFFDEV